MTAVAETVSEVRAWAAGLEGVHGRIAHRFKRLEVRRRALAYLRGLLSPVERKNGWQLAEQAGEPTPEGSQRLLATAQWDADAVRDDLRAYVVAHLGDPGAVLVVDETGFLKKGRQSVGVQRQDSGTAGRIEHCQIGVFLASASAHGRTFLDRELYLPQDWAGDPARRAEAGVPDAVAFRTKPQLAQTMLERALEAGVPSGWVTGDAVSGGDRRLRRWLEARGVPHVLAIKRTEPLWALTARGPAQVPAEVLVAALPLAAWQRLSAGDGAKGPRRSDWARLPIRPLGAPGWGSWLLVRRSLTDPPDLASSVCFAPAETPLDDLVHVAGARWTIEECWETAKGDVGLDHYEVRKWASWYRHITLALLAHAFLTITRAQAGSDDETKGGISSR